MTWVWFYKCFSGIEWPKSSAELFFKTSVRKIITKVIFNHSLDSQECRLESGNRLTFNYNIEFLCWDCYEECEGIMLRKFVGQIQSDLHICKLGMSQ